MNIILLEDTQFISEHEALATPRQSTHIKQILKSASGDRVSIGRLGGALGSATVHWQDDRCTLAEVTLDTPPPSPLPLSLILAMPRPQMLKRILQTVSMFGVSRLYLIQTARVEKSFWSSPSATEAAMREQLLLGLEQAKATQLPQIHTFRRFREFVEDHCPGLTAGHRNILAHPGPYPFCPSGVSASPLTLAVGPEGGFNEFEVERFIAGGFEPVQFGPRILKVETAVTALLARLM